MGLGSEDIVLAASCANAHGFGCRRYRSPSLIGVAASFAHNGFLGGHAAQHKNVVRQPSIPIRGSEWKKVPIGARLIDNTGKRGAR